MTVVETPLVHARDVLPPAHSPAPAALPRAEPRRMTSCGTFCWDGWERERPHSEWRGRSGWERGRPPNGWERVRSGVPTGAAGDVLAAAAFRLSDQPAAEPFTSPDKQST